MNINKNKTYTIIILALTAFTIGCIVFSTPSSNVLTPSPINEDGLYVDDITLDSFINIYALDILKLESYELTNESREKTRTLLSSMGAINIQKLQQILFKGNKNEMVGSVQSFVEDNFLWEEKALMVQYIIE